jgi:hypothetical protein
MRARHTIQYNCDIVESVIKHYKPKLKPITKGLFEHYKPKLKPITKGLFEHYKPKLYSVQINP